MLLLSTCHTYSDTCFVVHPSPTLCKQFAGIAAEIVEVSKQGDRSIATVMEEFSVLVTSTAMSLNQTWPYVTIPDFERRAAASRKVAGLYTLKLTTRIPGTEEDRAKTNEYLDDNLGWYYEACNITGRTPGPIFPLIMEGRHPDVFPANSSHPNIIFTQYSPPPSESSYRLKFDYSYMFAPGWNFMSETKRRAVSPVEPINAFVEDLNIRDPTALYYQPIFTDFSEKKELGAFVAATLRFQDHFTDVLQDSAVGIIVVLNNTCGQVHTYEINGPNATWLGPEDLHDRRYDAVAVAAGLNVALDDILEGATVSDNGLHCGYSIVVYPSVKFRSEYDNNQPLTFTLAVLVIFGFTSCVFCLFDCLVQRRQKTVMSSAVRTDAIVASLIPAQFRDQLLEEATLSKTDAFSATGVKGHLQDFMADGLNEDEDGRHMLSKPVADLFPEATVLFADISGFTAWSSVREPTQVFTLLESIYRAFDSIAKRRGVYKVETVGDSYVAVVGVPIPRKDHAVAMTRFARDCLLALPKVVLKLERILGPGTGDLGMRFGMHSGPVTAGVLRGDKARFQLFGDTVNTAAHVETTGMVNRVHMTEQTANLLIAAGKSLWVIKRDDPVHAKGKGALKTYWLQTGTKSRGSLVSGSEEGDTEEAQWASSAVLSAESGDLSKHVQRLVDWNVEQLLRILKQVVAARGYRTTKAHKPPKEGALAASKLKGSAMVLDEVTEIITLPKFDSKHKTVNPDSIELGPAVVGQMYKFVSFIAGSYRNNPFHNFEHASHVSMSVNKLLSRIVAPDVSAMNSAAFLHDYTYGITSDPLTHFAVVFSALIHDADHRGVSNGQLAKEAPNLARVYKNKSIAEQNSVDISWDLLMEAEFNDLRACIYSSEDEMQRFRQIVVNSVMATDIFDKELSALRKTRWDKAFQEKQEGAKETKSSRSDDVNRKATIVIEHIIQASDVAHTMQHWHVYTKWNEKLFQEMYLAYLKGRMENDPSVGWVKGEIWFFDCYVIPLSKKLDSCGIFGVSSDEYYSYAVENRKEWEHKGEAIVVGMVQKCKSLFGDTMTSIEQGDANISGV
jgi:class 3 adenylate cyclase